MTESSHHENIELLTYAEVIDVKGFVGNFDVTIRMHPRSVDMSKCTGCGDCLIKCPAKVPSEADQGLGTRKAIYKPFSNAVPNVPVIDREHCIYFTKGKCQICQKVCKAGAINYEQEETIRTEKFGAIVVATAAAATMTKWIRGAIKHPGALRAHCARKYHTTNVATCATHIVRSPTASAHRKRQARLAQTLRSFRHRK